jgi:hypothetical protein
MDISSIVLSKYIDGGSANLCTLSLDNTSYSDPYIIRNITGLDVEEITPRLYATGNVTGSKFFNMRQKPRNIAIRIILNPDFAALQTHATLRDELYKAISSDRGGKINLSFMPTYGPEVATIEGFITKFESDVNTLTPEVQLTITCEYPYFRKRLRTSVLAGLSTLAPVIIDNFSTAPHGFRMTLTFTSTVFGSPYSFKIQKPSNADWKFEILGWSFAAGDQLFFSSEEDNKYLYVVRGSTTTNLMGYLTANSQWPIIFPGTNTFTIAGTGSQFTYSLLDHYETFWGL